MVGVGFRGMIGRRLMWIAKKTGILQARVGEVAEWSKALAC